MVQTRPQDLTTRQGQAAPPGRTASQGRSALDADPYASRVSADWEAVPREDPAVWGDRGPLSASELNQYGERGLHFDAELFSDEEISTLHREASGLAQAAQRGQPGVITEPVSETVRSLFRVHRTSAVFRAVCSDRRLVDVARQVLGGDVYVHQSRINFKPAFDGREFFWHSDFETWHVEDGMPRMRAVSVSLNLTVNHEFNGPLMVIPGSHQYYVRCVGRTPEDHYKQSLKRQEYGVPSLEALRLLVDRGGIEAPKGRAGSALFFECNTMHGSAGNLSPYPRTNLFVVFNSVDNFVVEPFGGMRPRPDFLCEREPPTAGA